MFPQIAVLWANRKCDSNGSLIHVLFLFLFLHHSCDLDIMTLLVACSLHWVLLTWRRFILVSFFLTWGPPKTGPFYAVAASLTAATACLFRDSALNTVLSVTLMACTVARTAAVVPRC
jgi:hypothetical protein